MSKTANVGARGLWWWTGGILGSMAVVGVALAIWIHHHQVESRPYKDAVAKILANPEAVALLGTPVSPGFIGTETDSSVDHHHRVQLTLSVHGPKAEGTLEVDGREKDGQWSYALMLLTAGGEQLDLLATAP